MQQAPQGFYGPYPTRAYGPVNGGFQSPDAGPSQSGLPPLSGPRNGFLDSFQAPALKPWEIGFFPDNRSGQLQPYPQLDGRGSSGLMPRIRGLLPSSPSSDSFPVGSQVLVGDQCANKVDGLHCWEVHWYEDGPGITSELCSNLSALIEGSKAELLKKRSCFPTISCGIFMVGRNKDEAQPRFVISCDDSQVCKRLKRILKTQSLRASYIGFKPLISTSFPRSQIPLQQLSIAQESTAVSGEGDGSEAESDAYTSSSGGIDGSISEHSLNVTHHHDVFAKSPLFEDRLLVLPAAVSIESSTSSHTATISGLFALEPSGHIFAVTVAHALVPPATKWILEGTQKVERLSDSDSDSHESAGHDQLFPPSGTGSTSALAKVGSVVKSSTSVRRGHDWALIELRTDIEVCTLAPYPTRISQPVGPENFGNGRREIYVKTKSAVIFGILFLNPYYIRPKGEEAFIEVWTVKLDNFIWTGDCGAWVVGTADQELYGYVAFGHPSDNYAYVIAASSVLKEITTQVSEDVAICASGLAFKQIFSKSHQAQSASRPEPQGDYRFSEATFQHHRPPSRGPYPANPWEYQNFQSWNPQAYSENSFRPSSADAPRPKPQQFQTESSKDETIAMLEKLIVEERARREASEAREAAQKAPPKSKADLEKDEAVARLEKLILEERTEREARELREATREAAREAEAAAAFAKKERAVHEKKVVEEAVKEAVEKARSTWEASAEQEQVSPSPGSSGKGRARFRKGPSCISQ
ncbi:hypothetical protein BJX66DRAFT_338879 [Aspergillus keveii]|uniref:Uncharacterized protein n=1 Tax=Aspergillus keveii TaxID=714993 RepID=A0ABR4G316_9EURO